jgi:tetratricopeptide (TPR) repeat protein
VAVLGAAALAGALERGAHDVAADRVAVRAALAAVPSSRPEAFAPVRAALRRAMLAHPAEPYFALLGGEVAFRARDQSAIPWIQRALERGQMNGRAHHLLARVLASIGSHRQALLELRLAVENDASLVGPVAMLAVRWGHTFDDLLTAVPDGKDGAVELAEMGRLLLAPPFVDPILRGQCDREAILRDPMQVDPRLHEVDVRFAALEAGDPGGICASLDHCRAEILEHADAIAMALPDASTAVAIRARLLLADGKPAEAVKLLEKGCERVSDRPGCLRMRVLAAAKVKTPGVLDGAAKDLLGAACYSALSCADNATWLAGVRLQRGDTGTALSLFLRAAREDPNSEDRWMRVADVAGPSGAHAQAADALEKVAKHRGGADPALKARIDAERREALGGMIKR